MENITDSCFHAGKEKYRAYLNRLMIASVEDGRITERDRNQIQAFIAETKACGKLSTQREYKLAYQLVGIRKFLPEYSTVDTSSVFSGINLLKAESGYSLSTLADMIKLCKRFLLWLSEAGDASPELKPEKLRKIQAHTISATKTAEDIITPEQVELLFKNTTTTRNRAIIELLYESAGRAGEIATLTWGQITFYQNYASLRLDGKTGKTRTVPLYSSHVILRRWKDQYPSGEPGPDELVFPARPGGNDPLSYNGLLKIVRTAAKRAGIEQSISLHTFRHSRITHLLQAGMNESTIRLLAWGDVGSTMLKVYSHLTSSDVENAFASLYGIKPIEEFRGMDAAVSPRQCPTCGMLNPAGNSFCGGCGIPLTHEAGERMSVLSQAFRGDPRYEMIKKEVEEAFEKAFQKVGL